MRARKRRGGRGGDGAAAAPSFTQHLPRGTVLFDQHRGAELPAPVARRQRSPAGAGRGRHRNHRRDLRGRGALSWWPAAMLGLPYHASGAARTDIRVLMIPADVFREGIAGDPASAEYRDRAAVAAQAPHG
ncbi:hypothetical protein [Dankookia sp. P2]|uniref:hypothetical protein n=1 Tax=Dankookia sp. P2 TaxID=3423955 RepID=UPI003D676034